MKSKFIQWYFNQFHITDIAKLMAATNEGSPHHKERNVLVHTNMVVSEYISLSDNIYDWNIDTLLGALACAFHDAGKPASEIHKSSEERGDYRAYHGHELISSRIWEDWAVNNMEVLKQISNCEFDASHIYAVGWMISNHLPYSTKKPVKLAAIKQTLEALSINGVFPKVLAADSAGRITDNHNMQAYDDFFYSLSSAHPHINRKPPNGFTVHIPIAATGTGKGSLRRELPDTIRSFSYDDLRHNWYHPTDYAEAFRLSVEDAEFKMKANQVYLDLLKEPGDIFVDNVNLTKKSRTIFVENAKSKGYKVVAYLLPVSLATILDRQQTRTDKTVPDQAVRDQYFRLQYPSFGDFAEVNILSSNFE